MKTNTMLRLAAGALALLGVGATGAVAAEGTPIPPRNSWTFSGPFGHFDATQLQRGFKVYREVCANCHSVRLLKFRNLSEEGGPLFSEAQVKALAAEYKVTDGPNDSGDMFQRPARAADAFPPPFPNNQAAAAANGGAIPPDFSVIAKARTYERGFPTFVFDIFTQFQEQGQDYIHALIGGYEEAPEGMKPPKSGLHYNRYFPGHWIGMAPPIADGQVEYTDGTPTTVDQYGKDIAAFLTWAAEPHLAERKKTGLVVMLYLIIFGALLYFVKKRVWAGWKPEHA
jgi:ubiquinol-cytochrome c reductase cytochrome c1 subunit